VDQQNDCNENKIKIDENDKNCQNILIKDNQSMIEKNNTSHQEETTPNSTKIPSDNSRQLSSKLINYEKEIIKLHS